MRWCVLCGAILLGLACGKPSLDLGPGGVLLVCQSRFASDPHGSPVPQPARLELFRVQGGKVVRTSLDDSLSNVFHKAMVVQHRGQTYVVTIGGDRAALTFWKPGPVPYEPLRVWQPSFGGKHDRIRDVEWGDVDGDGQPDLVMATHDQGVVAVARWRDPGWEITLVDSAPSTFVHEVEIGDVDRDGSPEFYATPSHPNKASGASQPGAVVRYAWDGERFTRSMVDSFPTTHAKEILVANLSGGGDDLYVVREAHTTEDGQVISPVTILRYTWREGRWVQEVVAQLPDRQCRFLLAADLDHDGSKELVAAGFRSGLWWIRPASSLPWPKECIDAQSSGFEHACAVADMDGDGTQELYVASDDQKQVRRYVRRRGVFHPTIVATLDGDYITWGITPARL